MIICLVHIALPSAFLVWMVRYCDQSYFGWTSSPLLITFLQNIIFNSWISQFCMMQLGVTLQKDDWLLWVWSIWVIGAAGHSCAGCRRQGKVWMQHELREPLFRKGEVNQSGQDIWRAEKKGCEWLMRKKSTLEKRVTVEKDPYKHVLLWQNYSDVGDNWESKGGFSFNES